MMEPQGKEMKATLSDIHRMLTQFYKTISNGVINRLAKYHNIFIDSNRADNNIRTRHSMVGNTNRDIATDNVDLAYNNPNNDIPTVHYREGNAERDNANNNADRAHNHANNANNTGNNTENQRESSTNANTRTLSHNKWAEHTLEGKKVSTVKYKHKNRSKGKGGSNMLNLNVVSINCRSKGNKKPSIRDLLITQCVDFAIM